MSERRPAGGGGVEHLRSGKWRVRVTLDDGRRVPIGSPYATEAEAREVLDAYLLQAAEAGVAATGAVTLATFGRKFLDDRELRGVRGIAIDRARWAAHIESSFLATWPIADVTSRDVRRWRDEMLAKKATTPTAGGTKLAPKRATTTRKLSRQSVKNAMNLLRVAFAAAVEEDLIPANPALGVRIEREQRTEDPWTYLHPEEQAAILALGSMDPMDRLLVQFTIGTGLRKGELASLLLADVRVDGEDPEVIVRFGSPGKPTKSGRIRHVPLFGIGLDAAKRWLAGLSRYAKRNPLKLFAPTRRGYCRHRRPFRTLISGRPARWPDVVRAAGIERRVRWHDLRHTCASSLVAGWWGRRWSLEEVREVLGHTSIVVTQRYAHLAASAVRAAARQTKGNGGTDALA